MTETISFIAHKIYMPDVEDPVVYAGEPMYKWEQSEAGQWLMKRAIETPSWNLQYDNSKMITIIVIQATLTKKDHIIWKLKYE